VWYGFRRYVSAAERRRKAQREMARFRKLGHAVSPVLIAGRTIARTFWGQAWCQNLERYSDFSNRLPRGRTYVRNGSVLDLQIAPGRVRAKVSGSEIYDVAVEISSLPKARWSSICVDCVGAIDSLVELLQGRFSKGVMERICQPTTGLFPAPKEIEFSCSCPDWASMCKHVAAVLYGVGARLDERPELLFALRKVDQQDLVAKAGRALPLSKRGPARDKILAEDGLSELFGLDLGTGQPASGAPRPAAKPPGPRRTTKPVTVTGGGEFGPGSRARRSSAEARRSRPGSAVAKPGARPKRRKAAKR